MVWLGDCLSRMCKKSFPENFKNIRKLRGLTQKQLSKKAGISLSYISKIEAGYIKPYNITLGMIFKLNKAYCG